MAKKQNALGFQDGKKKGPVECLGMKFDSDEARREHFLSILREKLKDPEFRKIEGFPIGEDEDILALSDPPYYTACPNPFIEDFIKSYGRPYNPETDDYHREPFAADVSEGKNDPIYLAHSYHTKVPHKAIMRYILHYTKPEDIVLDGFCGTGMTGVAAELCADKSVVESLGYKVQKNGTILDEADRPLSGIGARRAILNDLAPAASFIAYNYNSPVDLRQFLDDANKMLDEVEDRVGWMYLTLHDPSDDLLREATEALQSAPAIWSKHQSLSAHWGRVNYVIWSDVFACPECSGEVVFWDVGLDLDGGSVRDDFGCPSCGVTLSKRNMERERITVFDIALNKSIQIAKQVPVLINYSVGKTRFEKKPDEFDLALLRTIEQLRPPHWFPVDQLPDGFNTGQPRVSHGATHVHHFFTARNLIALSAVWQKATTPELKFLFTASLPNCSRLYRFRTNGKGGTVSGTLYICSTPQENAVVSAMRRKLADAAFLASATRGLITTGSASALHDGDAYVDYIFTDPPFGGNLMYSELNFLWEAWLQVTTENRPEAIQSSVQGKGLPEYQELMTQCFAEYYRVLKPGRWMTVEFHNSHNRVWNSIQEALQRAGFVVADVRTLDKQQGSFKQVTSASAVKQDLVISSYKPNGGLEARFVLEAGTEEGVWDFVRTHLKQLPVFVVKQGQSEVVAERQGYLLFDRMVAFHVQRGVTVPLSAAEFYGGLRQRFPERDGMFFLPEQAGDYDRRRLSVREVLQLQLFVTDESSAIQWVRQQLSRKPQTFQELQPQFMQEVKAWLKHEKTLELSEILTENFVCFNGTGDVPSPIHAYLSSNYHELRSLPKDHTALASRAKDRWYVPDPNREGDLEKIRLRALMKEFEEYQATKGKLKVVRTEALRAGFKQCWQDGNYSAIVDLAKRLPSAIIEEDPALLMYYDNALLRTEG